MRAALLILPGLVIGVLGTVNVMGTLAERNPMPKALMHTMDYHMGQLSQSLKTNKCDAVAISHHLQRIQSTASDIVPVFKINEKPFTDAAMDLQRRTQHALQSTPSDCAALAAAIKPIRPERVAHQKYR